MADENNTSSRSTAQKAADGRYDEKRKAAPRLPGTRLTDEQGAVMDNLYKLFDGKAEAIVTATKYYLDAHK